MQQEKRMTNEDFITTEDLAQGKRTMTPGGILPPGVDMHPEAIRALKASSQPNISDNYIPDLEKEQQRIDKHTMQNIEQAAKESAIRNKLEMAQERSQKDVESISTKYRPLPNSPKDILKEIITRGELVETFEYLGHSWTLRALDQGDILLAMEDIRDESMSTSGFFSNLAFSKVVYSVEAIDGVPIHEFFPEVTMDGCKSRIEFIIKVKKHLKNYMQGFPGSVIDYLYDKYIEIEKKRDQGLIELKNS